WSRGRWCSSARSGSTSTPAPEPAACAVRPRCASRTRLHLRIELVGTPAPRRQGFIAGSWLESRDFTWSTAMRIAALPLALLMLCACTPGGNDAAPTDAEVQAPTGPTTATSTHEFNAAI